jgi:hypothetical protein
MAGEAPQQPPHRAALMVTPARTKPDRIDPWADPWHDDPSGGRGQLEGKW